MFTFFIFLQAKYAGCVAFICVVCKHTIDKAEYMIMIAPPGLS